MELATIEPGCIQVISQQTYNNLKERLQSPQDVKDIYKKERKWNYHMLYSIYVSNKVEFAKKSFVRLKSEATNRALYQRFLAGESLEMMAKTERVSPFPLAKIIVGMWLFDKKNNPDAIELAETSRADGQTTDRKASTTAAGLSDPQKKIIKDHINNILRIKNERLRAEVARCIAIDDAGSPLVDKIKAAVGIKYEFMLLEKLSSLGIKFASEAEQRSLGEGKTPDVLLETPIQVHGRTIAWIESKGTFGDALNFESNMRQVETYYNRWGLGLLIYWHGYIMDLKTEADARYRDVVIIMDRFPGPNEWSWPPSYGRTTS